MNFCPVGLQEGRLVRSLKGHGHWVNTLALSAEYALRTGAYDHTATAPSDPKEAQAKALQRCAPLPHFQSRIAPRIVQVQGAGCQLPTGLTRRMSDAT